MKRMLARLALLAFVVVGISVTTGAPSFASCPSSARDCNGVDPQSSGCSSSGAYTEYSSTANPPYYTYQLRRSTGCGAAWGRYVRDDCSYPNGTHRWLRVESELATPYGYYSIGVQTRDMFNATGSCNGGTAWTPMAPAYSGTRVRLCWSTTTTSGTPSSWSCTGWYYY